MWVNHPTLDWLLSIVPIVGERLMGEELAQGLEASGRFAWYIALATVFGSLAGFTVAANAVVLALTPSTALNQIIRTVGVRLQRLLLSSMFVLAVIALAMTLAIPLDGRLGSTWMDTYVVGLLSIGLLRLLRYMWLFDRILSIRREASVVQGELSGGSWKAPEILDSDYLLETRELR